MIWFTSIQARKVSKSDWSVRQILVNDLAIEIRELNRVEPAAPSRFDNGHRAPP